MIKVVWAFIRSLYNWVISAISAMIRAGTAMIRPVVSGHHPASPWTSGDSDENPLQAWMQMMAKTAIGIKENQGKPQSKYQRRKTNRRERKAREDKAAEDLDRFLDDKDSISSGSTDEDQTLKDNRYRLTNNETGFVLTLQNSFIETNSYEVAYHENISSDIIRWEYAFNAIYTVVNAPQNRFNLPTAVFCPTHIKSECLDEQKASQLNLMKKAIIATANVKVNKYLYSSMTLKHRVHLLSDEKEVSIASQRTASKLQVVTVLDPIPIRVEDSLAGSGKLSKPIGLIVVLPNKTEFKYPIGTLANQSLIPLMITLSFHTDDRLYYYLSPIDPKTVGPDLLTLVDV